MKIVTSINITKNIGFIISKSENNDDGCWWYSEHNNNKKYKFVDFSYESYQSRENLFITACIVFVGKFAVCFYRFQNK